ncbi:MAG: Crp/Fnr family transcriptional regulator [Bacteroidota bacterium]|nr:Crp/Fnr family transcriptional regulator [Bacteroidota bacterium]
MKTQTLQSIQEVEEDFIRTIPILDNYCTSNQKKMLQESATRHIYRKNNVIFYDFQPASFIYIIYKGKLKLWMEGIHSHDMIVSFAKDGDILGYRGCGQKTKYNLSATTIEDSCIYIVSKDVFGQILQENQELYHQVLWKYVGKLGMVEKKLRNMAEMNVREKTADAILHLTEEFGLDGDEATLAIKLSREEIASIAGISTDRIVKQFSEFEEDNLLEVHGQCIKILDKSRLEKIISQYL